MVKEIIPGLLVGRWNEDLENDKLIVEKLAGENYEDYSKKLRRWLNTPDSPFVKIGSSWRLVSPLDAWTNVSRSLTRNDFELLRKAFSEILSELNPSFELEPERRYMASLYGKKNQFSDWIREGITQSLILVSIFGSRLEFDLPVSGEAWVDRIIAEFLNTDDPLFWKSIEGKLPLISEASPSEFLTAVEKHLFSESSPIVALFQEDQGFLTPQSYHTGLLWALEGLAWSPDYLSRVSLILARLSSLDPGGSLSNRPINSLSEIFRPWNYQTLAAFDERIAVLKLIAIKEPDIAWKLLVRMLPDDHGIGDFTHKMRWRLFNQSYEKSYPDKEIWDTHTVVVKLLISLFDFTEIKLDQLINESVNLDQSDRDILLSYIESNFDKIIQEEFITWNSLRDILHNHRSYPDTFWALPESTLKRYENLYHLLEPKDDVLKITWLFNDSWPSFPEGRNDEEASDEEQSMYLNEKRVEGLNKIYNKYGIERIKELALQVNESGVLGNTLGQIVSDEGEIFSICSLLKMEDENLRFVHHFILRKSLLCGTNWVFKLFKNFRSQGFNNRFLAQLLVPLDQNQELWTFIEGTNNEINEIYWTSIFPIFWNLPTEEKVKGITSLINHKRFISAIYICYRKVSEMPSDKLVEVLEKAALEKANENIKLGGHEIEKIFDSLDNRKDVARQTLINLEWYYLPVLASRGHRRNLKLLHEELSNNPKFFITVLTWVYKPDNDEVLKEERRELSDDQIQNRAEHAYKLLNSWKAVPGVSADGSTNSKFFFDWINSVRELASECGRTDPADIEIGRIFAYYPENVENWPSNEICQVIENRNPKVLKDSFYMEISNKRSFSSRGPFEGGNIERRHATYFQKLADHNRNKFPIVAGIFDVRAKEYLERAKSIDEEAQRGRLEY